jgi:cell division protein FtsI/penicillin-binding protein 2
MMVSVTENGFGKAARIPGYYVAGKTGTAQVSFSSLGEEESGYSDKTWQSFVGFAPAFNPQFLILVKLDNPATKTAEYSAVPIFKELAKYIIDYYNIPPDYEN